MVETLECAAAKRDFPPDVSVPYLNARAERFVLSVKTECLSRMILFGKASLRRALSSFLAHYHVERPHQGKGNVILFPEESANTARAGPVRSRERLGGLLRFYYRGVG
jgi:transposase InsO family protein